MPTPINRSNLDPAWMAALGFVHEDDGKTARWVNDELKVWFRDWSTLTMESVIDSYRRAVERKTVIRQQLALREALLPAMGLEVKEEYSNDGWTERTYVRPEDN